MSLFGRADRFHALLLILILLTLLVYGLTIRDGLDWSEDSSHYIQHAVNLAEGHSYNHLATPDLITGRTFSYPYGLPVILGVQLILGAHQNTDADAMKIRCNRCIGFDSFKTTYLDIFTYLGDQCLTCFFNCLRITNR